MKCAGSDSVTLVVCKHLVSENGPYSRKLVPVAEESCSQRAVLFATHSQSEIHSVVTGDLQYLASEKVDKALTVWFVKLYMFFFEVTRRTVLSSLTFSRSSSFRQPTAAVSIASSWAISIRT